MSIPAKPVAGHPGAALEPTGNPMKDGLGAAAWAVDRADRPDLTVNGAPRIQPMRVAHGFSIADGDPDPRAMTLVAADGRSPGKVTDVWVDLAEPAIRYLEVELSGGGGTRLVPMGYVSVKKRAGELRVQSIFSGHFADVPTTRSPDRVTLLEEDRIVAYYAGGYRYAEPSRLEPLF
jgi:photosynthetic reaction center H subunit